MEKNLAGPRALIDFWHRPFFDKFTPQQTQAIAWSDYEAVIKYPRHAKVYDKAWLFRELNQQFWLEPPEKEAFVKPRINLWGMGRGARVHKPGNIYEEADLVFSPALSGRHLSTDLLLEAGRLKAAVIFQGIPRSSGFDYWVRRVESLPKKVLDVIDILQDFTGLANVETVGGEVIEVHLRGSLQFFDISSHLFECALGLRRHLSEAKPGFSLVVHSKKDGYPLLDRTLPPSPDSITSVQLGWEPGGLLSDEAQGLGSYVLGWVNGRNLQDCKQFGKILSKHIDVRRKL